MVAMFVLSLITISAALTIHLFNISFLVEKLTQRLSHRYVRLQAMITIAILSQMLNAGVFSLAYLAGMELNLGDFKSSVSLKDIYFFSLTTITTLGLGSEQLVGDLRMLAGVESATGFFLITCSASKFYQFMTDRA